MTHISQDYKHLEEQHEQLGHVVYGWSSLAEGIAFLNEHNAQLISACELVQVQAAAMDKRGRCTTLETALLYEDVCVAEAVVYRPHDRAVFVRKSPVLDQWDEEGKWFTKEHLWLHKKDEEIVFSYEFKANEYARDALALEEQKQDVAMRNFFIPLEFQPFTLTSRSNAFWDEVAHNFHYPRAYEHPFVHWLCQESEEQRYIGAGMSFSDNCYRAGRIWVKVDLLDKHYIDKQEKPFLKQIAISALRSRYSSDPFIHIHCDTPNNKTLLFAGKIREKQGDKA